MLFKELDLNAKLQKAVEAQGFVEPTPIQENAIPLILKGRDLMASANTGTGKTAAFVLPALQRLMTPSQKPGKGPRVLVLTPTRELAMQVNEDIRLCGRGCRFTSGNVLGGMPYPPQIRLLEKPVDLLVATPGRLMDHMKSGRLDFSRLETLVLDEADRMLDMGFIEDVHTIANAVPKRRQTLLFSATLEGAVLRTAQALMSDPETLQLAVNDRRHELIDQSVYHADGTSHKHRLLSHTLSNDDLNQALIFTATKRGAEQLGRTLQNLGHPNQVLHGDMRQAARRRVIDEMRRGSVRLLVATDVAARGLDIKGLSHVINYELPSVAEDYIHRIGRTGRAGVEGKAISFIGPDDWSRLAGIERLTGDSIERKVVEGMEPKTREPKFGKGNTGRSFRPQSRQGRNFRRRSPGPKRPPRLRR